MDTYTAPTTPGPRTATTAPDTPEGAATTWAWRCDASGCLTVTTDGIAARIHSLQPGHVLNYLPVV